MSARPHHLIDGTNGRSGWSDSAESLSGAILGVVAIVLGVVALVLHPGAGAAVFAAIGAGLVLLHVLRFPHRR